jgi:hypothetical protein
MAITLFLRNKKPILGRCSDDYSTKMRLRYAPFYHAMDAQKGTTIRLDGREMIMLSSNDYLGLSFHPKVVEAGRAALIKWGTSTTGAGLQTARGRTISSWSRRWRPSWAARPATSTPPVTFRACQASPRSPRRAT